MYPSDTIAAISTALGQGAIALLRISGPGALSKVAGHFRSRDLTRAAARTAYLGNFTDDQGEIIDQVLLTCFRGPASYTGEDMVEIGCHGGLVVTRRILDLLLASGCRAAEPGEFTQRAFLNGKMDLTQAEAVMDLIQAQTDLAMRAAGEQLRGGLRQVVQDLREELLGIIAHVEAYIDFPDEDIDPQTGDAIRLRIARVMASIHRLLASADQGRILREGACVAICGAPNVGKSSLLNLLLGFERAIVSPTPGTTRDTVEEVINLKGLPLRLVDTAGFRDSEDAIEQQGVRRSQSAMEQADLVLEVIDGSQPASEARVLERPSGKNWLVVLNKADLGLHSSHDSRSANVLSCESRAGMDALATAIQEAVLGRGETWQSSLVAINARHQGCLLRTNEALNRATTALTDGLSPEFVAVDLREALGAIGEIVGRVDVEEILGEIFLSFCIVI